MQIPYRQYGSRLYLYLVCLATTWNLRFCALAPVGALFILKRKEKRMEYVSPQAIFLGVGTPDIISASTSAPEGEWDTEM